MSNLLYKIFKLEKQSFWLLNFATLLYILFKDFFAIHVCQYERIGGMVSSF